MEVPTILVLAAFAVILGVIFGFVARIFYRDGSSNPYAHFMENYMKRRAGQDDYKD